MVLATASVAFAQSSLDSITSPTMPTISSPVIGSGFYMPGSILSSDYKSNSSNQNSEVSSSKDSSSLNVSQDDSASTSEKKKVLSSISASEIYNLSRQGLLNNTDILGNLYSAENSNETKELLNKVLSEIEDIKDSNKSPTVIVKNSTSSNAEQNQATSKKAPSRILRFSVNGYDILKTCKKIYISDVQLDGSFLVTGDRNYSSDGKERTETFHLLFKTSPNEDNSANYSAAAAVTQDYLNENSFLYQLSKREKMNAFRVGNFLTMRTDDPDWKMEFLIDLGEN